MPDHVSRRTPLGIHGEGLDVLIAALPEEDLDETDLHDMRQEQRSNGEIALDECRSRERIRDFFVESGTDERRLLVIQTDAAECELPRYGVARPVADARPVDDRCARANRSLALFIEALRGLVPQGA